MQREAKKEIFSRTVKASLCCHIGGGPSDGRRGGWMGFCCRIADGPADGRTDGQANGWADGRTSVFRVQGLGDGQTHGRQSGGQMDRRMGRRTDGRSDGWFRPAFAVASGDDKNIGEYLH